MDTITAVRNRILQLCGEREISINKLATISALPPSSIKNILYGKSQNPKLITIKVICDGLGITLGDFFSNVVVALYVLPFLVLAVAEIGAHTGNGKILPATIQRGYAVV